MKPIENFTVYSRLHEFDENINFINALNEGDNGSDTNVIENPEIAEAPEDLMSDMAEAFNDTEDRRRRARNTDLKDLLIGVN